MAGEDWTGTSILRWWNVQYIDLSFTKLHGNVASGREEAGVNRDPAWSYGWSFVTSYRIGATSITTWISLRCLELPRRCYTQVDRCATLRNFQVRGIGLAVNVSAKQSSKACELSRHEACLGFAQSTVRLWGTVAHRFYGLLCRQVSDKDGQVLCYQHHPRNRCTIRDRLMVWSFSAW